MRGLRTLTADKLSLGYREWCHSLVARALLRLGEAAPAEAETRRATELAETAQLRRLAVLATRIEALIALGRGAEADEQARRALARIDELGSAGYVEIRLRLAAAEAFLFVNDAATAEHQLVLANRELDRRAQKIPDAAVRARYLRELPENARVRALLARFRPGGTLRQ